MPEAYLTDGQVALLNKLAPSPWPIELNKVAPTQKELSDVRILVNKEVLLLLMITEVPGIEFTGQKWKVHNKDYVQAVPETLQIVNKKTTFPKTTQPIRIQVAPEWIKSMVSNDAFELDDTYPKVSIVK